MRIIKNLITIGNHSKAVVIPHFYFHYFEQQGKSIKKVCLKIDENIVIEPIFAEVNQSNKNFNPEKKGADMHDGF